MSKRNISPVLLASIILLILLLGIFSINAYLSKSSELLITDIDKTYTMIKKDDLKAAKTSMDTVKKHWDSNSCIWSYFIDHNRIDSISVLILSSDEFILDGEKGEALSNLSSLKYSLQHIPYMTKKFYKSIL